MEDSNKKQNKIDKSVYLKAKEELLNEKMEAKNKIFSVILTVLSAIFAVCCTYAVNKYNDVNFIFIFVLITIFLGIICAIYKLHEKIDHCNQMLRQLYKQEKLDFLRAEQRTIFKKAEQATYFFSFLTVFLLLIYVVRKKGGILEKNQRVETEILIDSDKVILQSPVKDDVSKSAIIKGIGETTKMLKEIKGIIETSNTK